LQPWCPGNRFVLAIRAQWGKTGQHWPRFSVLPSRFAPFCGSRSHHAPTILVVQHTCLIREGGLQGRLCVSALGEVSGWGLPQMLVGNIPQHFLKELKVRKNNFAPPCNFWGTKMASPSHGGSKPASGPQGHPWSCIGHLPLSPIREGVSDRAQREPFSVRARGALLEKGVSDTKAFGIPSPQWSQLLAAARACWAGPRWALRGKGRGFKNSYPSYGQPNPSNIF